MTITLVLLGLSTLVLAAALLLWNSEQRAQKRAHLNTIRARADQRRLIREQEQAHARATDMLFDSERPMRLGEQESGIIVRVLDGFDAEIR